MFLNKPGVLRNRRARFQCRARKGYLTQLKATSLLFALIMSPVGQAQELPATMFIQGEITGNESVSPTTTDLVIVLDEQGESQGVGNIVTSSGDFAVEMTKGADYNGTPLTMRLRRGTAEFALLLGSEPVSFPFSGGLFPTRLTLNLSVGDQIAGTGETPSEDSTGGQQPVDDGGGSQAGDGSGGEDEATLPVGPCDVNGDQRFTRSDIELLKRILAGKEPDDGRADVNDDGLVNTRDAIQCIKTLRLESRRGRSR